MNAVRQVSAESFIADGATRPNIASVTFVPNGTFSGTIAAIAYTSTSAPLTISAPAGDLLSAIPITRSAGTLFAFYVT